MNLWTVILGIAGLAVVALMVLFGANLVRASRTGPRWKRTLVAASLSVLAFLGVVAGRGVAVEPATSAESTREGETSPVMAIFNLELQLEKLGRLTSSPDFDGAAAEAMIGEVDADVAILSKPANLARLTDKGRARAKILVAAAAKQTAVVRALIPIGTTNLAKSNQWRIVSDAWRYVAPLADSHMSSTVQRKIAQAKLKDAAGAISELTSAGLLSAAEAAMFTIDMNRLKSDLLLEPPTDSKVSCYDMVVMPAINVSMANLTKRVDLLKKVIASGRMSPAAMDLIVPRIQRELNQLADPKLAAALRTDAERLKAKKLHAEISAQIVQIQCSVLRQRLNRTSGWKTVEVALAAAAPLAKTHRSTSAQRVAAIKKMKTARQSIASLAQAELIAASEAELMIGEFDRLKMEIYREPPTDLMVSCYQMVARDPIGDSTKRLTKRVGLLAKLFESGRLNPLVAGKILPSITADIKTLENAKKAEALRKQAAALLARIDQKFSNGPK